MKCLITDTEIYKIIHQAPEPSEQPAAVGAASLLRHHRRGHRQGGGQVGAVQYSQYSTVQYSVTHNIILSGYDYQLTTATE